MEVVSPGHGANGHPPSSSTPGTVDPNLVVQYLRDLLEITLGATTDDLEGKGSLLSEAKRNDTVQRCTRFASELQVALYVQKSAIATDSPNSAANGHLSSGIFGNMTMVDLLLTSGSRTFGPLHLLPLFRNFLSTKHCCFGSHH